MTAYTVYTGEGSFRFGNLHEAESWLARRGFTPRVGQQNEYVCLDGANNRFASLRADVADDWKPNLGAMSKKAIRGE